MLIWHQESVGHKAIKIKNTETGRELVLVSYTQEETYGHKHERQIWRKLADIGTYYFLAKEKTTRQSQDSYGLKKLFYILSFNVF